MSMDEQWPAGRMFKVLTVCFCSSTLPHVEVINIVIGSFVGNVGTKRFVDKRIPVPRLDSTTSCAVHVVCTNVKLTTPTESAA